MLLPHDMQPKPPAPEPPPKPEPKKRASRAKAPGQSTRSGSRSSSAKASTPRPSTRLPKADTDEPPDLFGDKDLAYEVPEGNLRFHVQGPDSEWLPISSMPKELRPHGLVYLSVDDRLVARCRVKGIGFRARRWTHEAPGVTSDVGPGATLELHKDGWDFMSFDLGPDRDEVHGYRYLAPLPDDS